MLRLINRWKLNQLRDPIIFSKDLVCYQSKLIWTQLVILEKSRSLKITLILSREKTSHFRKSVPRESSESSFWKGLIIPLNGPFGLVMLKEWMRTKSTRFSQVSKTSLILAMPKKGSSINFSRELDANGIIRSSLKRKLANLSSLIWRKNQNWKKRESKSSKLSYKTLSAHSMIQNWIHKVLSSWIIFLILEELWPLLPRWD